MVKALSEKSGAKLAEYNRKHGIWNKGIPHTPEARAKMSAAQKKNTGSRSFLNGGNGSGGSKCENLLRTMLPENFITECTVSNKPRPEGYPTHYKLDFGDPVQKLGIEVQGNSHKSILGQERDVKKREKLNEYGWKILYITNKDVLSLFGTYQSLMRKPTLQEVFSYTTAQS
jgi:very-short-patch-repair endonuclease